MSTDLFTIFGKVALQGKDQVNSDLDSVTGNAEKSENKMVGAFKRIGAVLVTVFAVDKIKDFGQQLITTSANVQAETAQFQASFAGITDSATSMFESVAQYSGVLATRLRVEGTKAFSQFKGAGIEANQALGETENFLKLASDAAAYYDISLEEASQKVRSFSRGNVEAGDSIGLFTSESQRNQRALATYGMAYTKLTEAQKQMLMMGIVKEIYSQSGALGQASREASGFSNVTGNMKESWRQLMAVIGSPLLNLVIPIMQKLTEKLQGGIQHVTLFAKNFGTFWEQMKQYPIVQSLIGVFNQLKIVWDNVVASFSKGGEMFTMLSDIIGIYVDYWTGLFSGKGNLGETFTRMFTQIMDVAMPILADAFDFAKEMIGELVDFWNEYGDQIVQAVQNVFSIVAGIFEFFLPVLQWVVQVAFGFIKGMIQGALDVIIGLIKIFASVFTGDWQGVWDGIIQALSGAIDFIWNLIKFVLFTGILSLIGGFATGIIEGIGIFLSGITGTFTAWFTLFATGWSMLTDFVSMALTGMKDSISNIFNSVKTFVSNVWNGIKDAMTNPVQTAVDIVKGLIDKVRSFFNFEWSLPKLKMPHLKIDGEFSLVPPKAPKFDVEWYKDGGIMTKPTLFDFNPKTGTAKVGGEAGNEAIAPIDVLLGYIRTAVAEQNGGMLDALDKLIQMLADYFPQLLNSMNRSLVLDSGALVGQLAPTIDAKLGERYKNKERGQ